MSNVNEIIRRIETSSVIKALEKEGWVLITTKPAPIMEHNLYCKLSSPRAGVVFVNNKFTATTEIIAGARLTCDTYESRKPHNPPASEYLGVHADVTQTKTVSLRNGEVEPFEAISPTGGGRFKLTMEGGYVFYKVIEEYS